MSESNENDLEIHKEDQENIIDIKENDVDKISDEKSLVISEDVFPESLLLVPLYDRPLFPKMLLPVIISDQKLEELLEEEIKNDIRYVGLVYSFENEGSKEEKKSEKNFQNLAKIGSVGRIVQASKHGNDPMHIIVQVMERFEIIEFINIDPVFRAKVKYLEDTGGKKTEYELKAFSVSIINLIKELVQLNPLFKEELGLLMGRINLKDPATLADFAASMTTASGKSCRKFWRR